MKIFKETIEDTKIWSSQKCADNERSFCIFSLKEQLQGVVNGKQVWWCRISVNNYIKTIYSVLQIDGNRCHQWCSLLCNSLRKYATLPADVRRENICVHSGEEANSRKKCNSVKDNGSFGALLWTRHEGCNLVISALYFSLWRSPHKHISDIRSQCRCWADNPQVSKTASLYSSFLFLLLWTVLRLCSRRGFTGNHSDFSCCAQHTLKVKGCLTI